MQIQPLDKRKLVMGVSVLGLFILLGCLGGTSPSEKMALESKTFPFKDLVWLPDGRLMVFIDVPEEDVFGLRWYAIAGEWTPRELELPQDDRCLRGGYYWTPSLLPDGRLGFLEQCVSPGSGPNSMFMPAYDLETGETEQLVDASLPLDSTVIGTQYAWNPQMTLGLGDNWGDTASIYWISAAGYEFPDITISDTYDGGQRSWSLLDSGQAMEDPSKVAQVGMTRFPDWSPDGGLIAFMATVGPIGRQYASRHDVSWSLFLMTPDQRQPEPALSNIRSPFLLQFSPDGKWLLYGGQDGQSGDYGLWLYSLRSKEKTFIGKILDARAAWSPDSQRIAYIQCDKFSWRFDGTFGSCDEHSLNIKDVSHLTRGE